MEKQEGARIPVYPDLGVLPIFVRYLVFLTILYHQGSSLFSKPCAWFLNQPTHLPSVQYSSIGVWYHLPEPRKCSSAVSCQSALGWKHASSVWTWQEKEDRELLFHDPPFLARTNHCAWDSKKQDSSRALGRTPEGRTLWSFLKISSKFLRNSFFFSRSDFFPLSLPFCFPLKNFNTTYFFAF